jgi:hypothetical protein
MKIEQREEGKTHRSREGPIGDVSMLSLLYCICRNSFNLHNISEARTIITSILHRGNSSTDRKNSLHKVTQQMSSIARALQSMHSQWDKN